MILDIILIIAIAYISAFLNPNKNDKIHTSNTGNMKTSPQFQDILNMDWHYKGED